MTPSTSSSSLPAISTAVASPTGIDPAATLFPMMHGEELGLLVEDIAKNGLREPIVLYQGLILDGRNRLQACELAKVKPRFVEWDGVGSTIAFVLSRNLHRRHLSESQRSVVAARAKEMFKEEAAERQHACHFGSPANNPSNEVHDDEKSRVSPVGADLHRPERSNDKAAMLFNVSARMVALASRVLAAGDEQLIAAIELGLVTVSDAATILHLPKEQQREAVAKVRSGKFRFLQHAIEAPLRRATPGAEHAVDVDDDDDEPKLNRHQLRRAFKRFAEMQDKLVHEVDSAAVACGGPNDHTRRACEHLAQALRAMHECVNYYGRRRAK